MKKSELRQIIREEIQRLTEKKHPNRDYKKEYENYHSKPEQKKNNSMRHKARRKMGLKTGDPREVDHKKPLSKGGSNSKANLRVVSRDTNRKKSNNEGVSTTLGTDEITNLFYRPEYVKILKLKRGKEITLQDKNGNNVTISPLEISGKLAPGRYSAEFN